MLMKISKYRSEYQDSWLEGELSVKFWKHGSSWHVGRVGSPSLTWGSCLALMPWLHTVSGTCTHDSEYAVSTVSFVCVSFFFSFAWVYFRKCLSKNTIQTNSLFPRTRKPWCLPVRWGTKGSCHLLHGPRKWLWDSPLWKHSALVYGYLFCEHHRGLFQANYASGLRLQVIDSAVNIMEEAKAKWWSLERKANSSLFLAKEGLWRVRQMI